MKKSSVAFFIVLCLLIAIGCSSTPAGTIAIGALQKNPAQYLGQNVVCIGMADTRTPLSAFKKFKIYDGSNYIWVAIPEGGEEPPQGVTVRVTGTLEQQELNIVGKIYIIQATKVAME